MTSSEGRSDPPLTVSAAIGELTWLYSQSAKHQAMSIKELSWLLMTPVLRKQFHLFRDGVRPIGAAIWATVDAEVEAAILTDRFASAYLDEQAWFSGERLWLVELVAPFANFENKQAEIMLADLMTGIFRGRTFNMFAALPGDQKKERITIDGQAGDRLTRELHSALSL